MIELGIGAFYLVGYVVSARRMIGYFGREFGHKHSNSRCYDRGPDYERILNCNKPTFALWDGFCFGARASLVWPFVVGGVGIGAGAKRINRLCNSSPERLELMFPNGTESRESIRARKAAIKENQIKELRGKKSALTG